MKVSNNLSYVKKIKKEQRRRKKIIKAEINAIKSRNTIEKINETES